MPVLNPTPTEGMCDAQGRPYFLWDTDLTPTSCQQLLADADAPTQACLTSKLMRQAKPDDVFTFVSVEQIRDRWPMLRDDLGRTKPFWEWLLRTWGIVP